MNALTLLINHLSSAMPVLLAALLVAVCWATYKITRIGASLQKDIHHLQKDVSHLKKDVSHLQKDVGHLQKDVGQIRDDVTAIRNRQDDQQKEIQHIHRDAAVTRERMDNMSQQMDKMSGRQDRQQEEIQHIHRDAAVTRERADNASQSAEFIRQRGIPDAAAQSASPLQLSEIGKEIDVNIKADDLIAEYGARLREVALKDDPDNGYDIQKEVFAAVRYHLMEMLSKDHSDVIKQEAFSRDMLLDDVLIVVSIKLRNQIMEEKGIPIPSSKK